MTYKIHSGYCPDGAWVGYYADGRYCLDLLPNEGWIIIYLDGGKE